jgi:hypothetical protein
MQHRPFWAAGCLRNSNIAVFRMAKSPPMTGCLRPTNRPVPRLRLIKASAPLGRAHVLCHGDDVSQIVDPPILPSSHNRPQMFFCAMPCREPKSLPLMSGTFECLPDDYWLMRGRYCPESLEAPPRWRLAAVSPDRLFAQLCHCVRTWRFECFKSSHCRLGKAMMEHPACKSARDVPRCKAPADTGTAYKQPSSPSWSSTKYDRHYSHRIHFLLVLLYSIHFNMNAGAGYVRANAWRCCNSRCHAVNLRELHKTYCPECDQKRCRYCEDVFLKQNRRSQNEDKVVPRH